MWDVYKLKVTDGEEYRRYVFNMVGGWWVVIGKGRNSHLSTNSEHVSWLQSQNFPDSMVDEAYPFVCC